MPKRSTPFQAIVHLVRQLYARPGATVTESKLLTGSIPELSREVDIVIEGEVDGHTSRKPRISNPLVRSPLAPVLIPDRHRAPPTARQRHDRPPHFRSTRAPPRPAILCNLRRPITPNAPPMTASAPSESELSSSPRQ